MIDAVQLSCEWCTEEETFNGSDPEKEAREDGWFSLVDHGDEDFDFCSKECLKNWLF